MILYNGGNTQTSTQNSLTNKTLLIKYFVVFFIARSSWLLSHHYPDMEILLWTQRCERCGFSGQALQRKSSEFGLQLQIAFFLWVPAC